MPELPEVETTCRGISPHLLHKTIDSVILRRFKLRWDIEKNLSSILQGQRVKQIYRRAKYILIEFETGTLIIHLGMSGSLRWLNSTIQPEKHDHVDFVFDENCLRYRDPRRFGAILWTESPVLKHRLLATLGVEPLSDDFTAEYLYQQSRHRKVPVKTFIMDSHTLVGVGNIYACESLFKSAIDPRRLANKISLKRYRVLVDEIKKVLEKAIQQGGTTLKDFSSSDGKLGYFQQSLAVYGRIGLPCIQCQNSIKKIKQAQRSTFYCSQCQS
jgi:formamidopyrimidine-DNA glycosylase